MTQMVRKQIYIYKRQEALLKRLAQARGKKEAEIIREAIDHEIGGASVQPVTTDRQAWEEILRFVEARKALGVQGQPYKWNRMDAYEERESRWEHRLREDGESSDDPHSG